MRGLLLWLLVALGACAQKEWIGAPTSAASRAPRGGDAVVLLNELTVTFSAGEAGPIAEATQRQSAQLRQPNDRALGSIDARYSPQFSTVLSLRARVRTPDGKSVTFGRASAIDVHPEQAGVLYSDARVLHLTAPVRTPGTVLDEEVITRYLEPRLHGFTQRFGHRFPSAETRLVVRAPAGWRVEHLARVGNQRIEWAPVTTTTTDGMSEMVWERGPLPAALSEPGAPPLPDVPSVTVRLAAWLDDRGARVEAPRDARALSSWLDTLVRPVSGAVTETDRLARSLVEGLTDDTARARRLYSWVRDHVQYCAIEIGYGGFRPHPPRDVIELRYGDCKDKATLLRALLASVGVPSRLAVLYAHDGVPRVFGLPTPGDNFNHAITLVDLPSGTVIADPTSRCAPFGELPPSDQDAELLPLERDGADLMRAPAAPPEASTLVSDLRLRVSPDGTAEGELTQTATGSSATAVRTQLLMTSSGAREREVIQPWLALRGVKVRLASVSAAEPAELAEPFVARAQLTVPAALEGSGASRIVRASDVLGRILPSLPSGTRHAPLLLGPRMTRVRRVHFSLPSGWRASTLPPAIAIDARALHVDSAWSQSPDGVDFEERLTVRQRSLPPAEFAEARSQLDALLAAEDRPLVIHASAP